MIYEIFEGHEQDGKMSIRNNTIVETKMLSLRVKVKWMDFVNGRMWVCVNEPFDIYIAEEKRHILVVEKERM